MRCGYMRLRRFVGRLASRQARFASIRRNARGGRGSGSGGRLFSSTRLAEKWDGEGEVGEILQSSQQTLSGPQQQGGDDVMSRACLNFWLGSAGQLLTYMATL